MAKARKKDALDPEAERTILSRCLKDKAFLREAVEVAADHDFSSKAHGWVFRKAADHWRKHGDVLPPRSLIRRLRAEVKDPDRRASFATAIRSIAEADPVAASGDLALLRDFVRFQRMHGRTRAIVERLEAGDLDAAEDEFRAAASERVGRPQVKRLDWWGSFEERYDRLKAEKAAGTRVVIPTGIRSLDRIIGGHRPGELGMILATTGKGKSIFAQNFAVAAVLRGFGGIVFSLEMPAEQVLARLDSRILRVPYARRKEGDLDARDERLMRRHHAKRERTFKDRIEVVSVEVQRCTPSLLEEIVDERRARGAPTDFVIFDSLDHVQPDSRRESKRVDAAEVYWWAASLAMRDPALAVWTTCHAGREWRYKVATPEASAEAYDKARIATTVLSINQSRAEEKAGVINLYLAKYRDGMSWIKVPLSANYQMMTYREMKALPTAAGAGGPGGAGAAASSSSAADDED